MRGSRRPAALAALLLATAGCATLFGPKAPAPTSAPTSAPATAPATLPATAPAAPSPAWVSYPEAEVAGVKDPHAYRGQPLCQRCHQGETPALREEPIALCKACHPQRHGNHPVGVAQKKPAGDLPLAEGGRIACHTCHDPHDLKAQKKGLRLKFNDLCLKCHQQH